MSDLVKIARGYGMSDYRRSHSEGCERDHPECLILKMADEIERLRAEQDDKRELLQQLRFVRTHLYAATVQRSPADDRIIADHVKQAYLRANEVIKAMEAK